MDAALPGRSFDDAAAAQMERIVVDLRRMYHERNEALREVTRAHHEALLRLALAAELRDDDTGVHMARIGYLAERLALALGQPASFARMLRRAAPMHDVGKIGIPDDVLKKPGGYSADERRMMNQHAEMGADMLGRSRVPLFQLAAEVALTHHERWDGSGYPRGLAGEAIPLSGRIVAVVDFFDALTMDRCYRPAFGDDVALRMLAEQRGAGFDPRVVDTFIDNAAALIELRESINRAPPSFDDLVAFE
ncbi:MULTISPECIES: HD-GYP domain-containing protein [Roseateles]|uniref:HD domain-containing protein n=1 Tax=Pelomonas caseinilytica TaxID=2906763 RepID=A0ABS8XF19_9BURK|nr:MULTISPECIES: HD domain-containing phosphohydrolase [unclassified Roseateles]MCE4538072.1 HD domain-containing protein [Pelomonas sp. P7]HEV6967856.1 HD domain-containing phosphohydrolase [Roseateles sp.]